KFVILPVLIGNNIFDPLSRFKNFTKCSMETSVDLLNTRLLSVEDFSSKTTLVINLKLGFSICLVKSGITNPLSVIGNISDLLLLYDTSIFELGAKFTTRYSSAAFASIAI